MSTESQEIILQAQRYITFIIFSLRFTLHSVVCVLRENKYVKPSKIKKNKETCRYYMGISGTINNLVSNYTMLIWRIYYIWKRNKKKKKEIFPSLCTMHLYFIFSPLGIRFIMLILKNTFHNLQVFIKMNYFYEFHFLFFCFQL